MAATTYTLLDRATVKQGDAATTDELLDLGEHDGLEIVLTVHSAGEGDSAMLCLQHAPSITTPRWLDFPNAVGISLLRADAVWVSVPRFTRYVGWSVVGTLQTEAVVSVEIVPK